MLLSNLRRKRSTTSPHQQQQHGGLPVTSGQQGRKAAPRLLSRNSKILVCFLVVMLAPSMGVGMEDSAILTALGVGIIVLCYRICKTRKQQSGRLSQSNAKNRFNKKRIAILVVSLVFVGAWWFFNWLATALGYKPPNVRLGGFESNNNNHMLTVFLIDGLRADILENEMNAGKTPHLQQLAQDGCRVSHVAAPFPTITGYAYWPLLTGIEATRSNHLGTRYFDRRVDVGNWHNYYGPANKLFNPHFETTTKTLFEVAQGWSLSTNSFLSRGATLVWNTGTEQAFSKALHIWWLPQWLRRIPLLGHLIAPDFAEHEVYYMNRIIRLVTSKTKPSLVWVVFSGVDNAAHALGVGTEYRDTLHAIDRAIGTYVKTVRQHQPQVQHTFAVVSDHGEASVDIKGGGNLDLCDAFVPIGMRAWRGDSKKWSGKFEDALETFGADKDVLIGISGDMSATVYVKSYTGGWKQRTFESELVQYKVGQQDVNVIEIVLNYNGVQLVAWSRSNGVVAVQTTLLEDDKQISAVGVITFDKETGMISYRVEREEKKQQRCPLGYDDQLADGSPRSARQWLDATADTPYPYALVRLVQYFTVPGLAPDMVVTAHDGFDFGKDWEYYLGNFAGGHGGIHTDHMRVPAFFSGAGVPKAGSTEKAATVEDVGASLHFLMQKSATLAQSFTPAPLDFLKDHHDDVIAKAYQSKESEKENAAADLLRGKPLSCLL